MGAGEIARLVALERTVRRMRLFTVAAGSLVVLLITAGFLGRSNSILTVSELKLTDSNGVVRIHIAGDIPGERRGQGGEGAAGLLLFDATGTERGGYITTDSSGYVGITLDGRRVNTVTGSTQSAVFRADSTGSTTLRLWYAQDMFEIRADGDGARYSMLRGREVMTQEPQIANPRSTAVCTDLRQLRAQFDSTAVRRACRERMTDVGCSVCLGRP